MTYSLASPVLTGAADVPVMICTTTRLSALMPGSLPLTGGTPAAAAPSAAGHDPVTDSSWFVSEQAQNPVFVCTRDSLTRRYARGAREDYRRHTRGVPARGVHARDLVSCRPGRLFPELNCSGGCQRPALKPGLVYVRTFRRPVPRCQVRVCRAGADAAFAGRLCKAGVWCTAYRPDIGLDVLVCGARPMAGQPGVTQRSMKGPRLRVRWMLPASPIAGAPWLAGGLVTARATGGCGTTRTRAAGPYTTQIGGPLMERFLTTTSGWGRL